MAKILQFKRELKPITDKEYFDYASHTGLCPKCGKELKIIYTCQKCQTVTILCYCGFEMERSLS